MSTVRKAARASAKKPAKKRDIPPPGKKLSFDEAKIRINKQFGKTFAMLAK